VFVGGFDADSAASIVDSSEIDTRELLATFVDRSLLLRLENVEGAARYRMLETLRQYCMGQLDEQTLTAARDSHLAIFDRFVDAASAGIFGSDQLSWLPRLDAEYENIRSALAWSVEGGSVETGLRIGANLGRWWDWKGLLKEASEWLGQLSDAATGTRPGLSAVLAWRAFLQWEFGDIESATQLIGQASDASQAVGDPEDGLTMLSIRALISRSTKDLDDARQDCIDLASIGNATGNPWAEAWAHSALATIDLTAGDLEAADIQAQTAVEMFRDLGDVRGEGWGLVSMAQAAFGKKDLDSADGLARDALSASTTAIDHRTTSWVLELLAEIAMERGDSERAAILWGAAYPLLRQRGLTSSASKRDDLDNVETALRHDLGEKFSNLFAIGFSDPESVVSEELEVSAADRLGPPRVSATRLPNDDNLS